MHGRMGDDGKDKSRFHERLNAERRAPNSAFARTRFEHAFHLGKLFQLERWRTVFGAIGSSRANAAYLGFGIARTGPKALRMIVAHPFLGASRTQR